MRSCVMLRWIFPVRRPYRSPRDLIARLVTPAVREAGWLYSPGASHCVSDEGDEAWLTVVTHIDDATAVRDGLAEFLTASPTVETTNDVLLTAGAEPYRAALQQVTHVGLDVLEAGSRIPLAEYEAFECPSEAAPRLIGFLSEVSDTYRRTCTSSSATQRFWLDFFRRAPAPDLSAAGRSLWNLAG